MHLTRAPLFLVTTKVIVFTTCFFLNGCQSGGGNGILGIEPDRVDYRSVQKGNPLEIPPDLNVVVQADPKLDMPVNSVVSKVTLDQTSVAPPNSEATKINKAEVYIEKEGKQRWLVVRGKQQEGLWDRLKLFWSANGFNLDLDDPKAGVMATNFVENRAKIESDFIREGFEKIGLGGIIDSISSSGEKDQYRTRIESLKDEQGNEYTEIYITHKGISEEWVDREKTHTEWKTRETDRALENIFLVKLMNNFGLTKEEAQQKLEVAEKASEVQPTSFLKKTESTLAIVYPQNLETSWRRVGIALDRANFTIADSHVDKRTYDIRYIPLEKVVSTDNKGFFESIFGSSEEKKPSDKLYHVQLQNTNDDLTTIRVVNTSGQEDISKEAEQILKQLEVYLASK